MVDSSEANVRHQIKKQCVIGETADVGEAVGSQYIRSTAGESRHAAVVPPDGKGSPRNKY